MLPPNTTHALQPLDVVVFKAVKSKYSRAVLDWYDASGFKDIDKNVFPHLLKIVFDDLQGGLLIQGFKKAGLHPVDMSYQKQNSTDYSQR